MNKFGVGDLDLQAKKRFEVVFRDTKLEYKRLHTLPLAILLILFLLEDTQYVVSKFAE